MGVSCSADRNIKAKINRHGIWIEKLESNPGQYIPEALREQGEGKVVSINLNQPMSEDPGRSCPPHPVSTRLTLNGTIIVARDIAHAKLKELLDNGEALPQYVKRSPGLLRRSGENAGRLRVRFTRPNHRRAHGLLCRSAAVPRRQHW